MAAILKRFIGFNINIFSQKGFNITKLHTKFNSNKNSSSKAKNGYFKKTKMAVN